MLPNATLPDLGWYAMSMRGASSDVMNFPANLEGFAERGVSSELEWIQKNYSVSSTLVNLPPTWTHRCTLRSLSKLTI